LKLLSGIGGGKIGMDCSVVPMARHGLSMISTCDFFYPLVDDPFIQGKIGAANVLSDMYAMGVTQVDNVLMILASSNKMEEIPRDSVTRSMIEGFNYTCLQAGVECTGGQTVINPWPIIGGTAMSACSKEEFILPVSAVIGDVIVLTKPLGTQITVNLHDWKHREDQQNWIKASEVISLEDAEKSYEMAIESMCRLNRNAAALMQKYSAHACTDITGFGLLGHATNLVENQISRLDFEIHTLPIISGMLRVADHIPKFRLREGFSAETSGGLFVVLPADNAANFIEELQQLDKQPAWIIGRVVPAQNEAKNQSRIIDNYNTVEV